MDMRNGVMMGETANNLLCMKGLVFTIKLFLYLNLWVIKLVILDFKYLLASYDQDLILWK